MDFTSAFTFGCGGPGFWHGWSGGGMGFFPFHFGGLIPLLLVGLIVYFIVRSVRGTTPVTSNGAPSPLDVLKRRYAAGEIDRDTFNRMKDELK